MTNKENYMKKIMTLITALVVTMPFAAAIDTSPIDSAEPQQQNNTLNLRIDIEKTARLKELIQQMENLQNEYEKVAAGRNAIIEGASPLALERFYMQQDSVCMDIRSKIVDVQMQIDEIK